LKGIATTFVKRNLRVRQSSVEVQQIAIRSSYLSRKVDVTVILPPNYMSKPYPVIWFNDGQDFPALEMEETLQRLFKRKAIRHCIVLGVHANEDRMQEYGTSEMADYNNRGAKAGLYAEFFVNELLPHIRAVYNVSKDKNKNSIAGFSLGGLSALDIAWNYPDYFNKVGVFSGSLWWRKRSINRGYKDDRDRIIHQLIRKTDKREGMMFWLEAGTDDEKGDRNQNGVIDSIDDTVDLIAELKQKGYTDEDIRFVLVKGGEHNQHTWGEVMPNFLRWALTPVSSPVS
jgi:enterochelin esterase family protein